MPIPGRKPHVLCQMMEPVITNPLPVPKILSINLDVVSNCFKS